MGQSNTKYYVVIAIFAVVLLSIGVFCYTRKDNYKGVYDPLLEGSKIHPDKRLMKFFKELGADPEIRVNDQRYLFACQECDRSLPNLRPEACSKCTAFMSGVRRNMDGVL